VQAALRIVIEMMHGSGIEIESEIGIRDEMATRTRPANNISNAINFIEKAEVEVEVEVEVQGD